MRVISLLPAATEIVAAIGAGDRLVGVSHECDHPAFVRRLPRVTRSAIDASARAGDIDAAVRERSAAGAPLFELDAERLHALAPELLVTQALCEVCAVAETDVRAIAATLPLAPAVVTINGTTLAGVFDDVRRVGAALGRVEDAERRVQALERRVRTVHERLRAARAPRPRVAVIEWTDPVYTAGHWTPELVRRAGGADVLASAGEHSRRVAPTEIAAAAPEVLVIAPCGFDLARAADDARRLLASPEWAWARDVPVWALDGNALLSRPGPRLVDALEVLAAMLHPALFGTADRTVALRL